MRYTTLLIATVLFAHPAFAAEDAVKTVKPVKALLVIGGCCHDYAAQQKIITEGISARANVEWTIAYDPTTKTDKLNPVYEKADWAKGFDVVVHDECSADVKDMEIIDRILKPHREGLPAVLLHCAMHSYRSEGYPDQDTPWFKFTGVATTAHGPHEPLTISLTDDQNPITRGMKGWTTGKEELYNNARRPMDTTHVLARGQQGKAESAVVWTNAYGEKKTKVFATTLGHANELVGDPRYLDLITRGLLWSVDKLDEKHLKAVAKAEPAEPKQENAVAIAAKPADEKDCGCDQVDAR